MSKFINHRPLATTLIILIITITIAVAASFVTARTSNDVTLRLSGHVEREGKQINLSDSIVAKQGEILHFDLKAQNIGDPVNNFKATAQIPVGTAIVLDSPSQSAEYSLDGKAFSAKPQVEVVENGKKRMVDAPVDSYRAIAFSVPNNFKGEATMSYDVTVK